MFRCQVLLYQMLLYQVLQCQVLRCQVLLRMVSHWPQESAVGSQTQSRG